MIDQVEISLVFNKDSFSNNILLRNYIKRLINNESKYNKGHNINIDDAETDHIIAQCVAPGVLTWLNDNREYAPNVLSALYRGDFLDLDLSIARQLINQYLQSKYGVIELLT